MFMTECHQEDWISGMWFVMTGVVATVSGLVSMLAVAPFVLRS